MNSTIVKMFSRKHGCQSVNRGILIHCSKLKRAKNLSRKESIRDSRFLGLYLLPKIEIAPCQTAPSSFSGTKRLQTIIRCIIILFNILNSRIILLQAQTNKLRVTIVTCLQTIMQEQYLLLQIRQLDLNIQLQYQLQFQQEILMIRVSIQQTKSPLHFIQICSASTTLITSFKCLKCCQCIKGSSVMLQDKLTL